MRVTQHPSNTTVLGAPPGWKQDELPCGALPVTLCMVEGKPAIVSFWRPTAEEIELLKNGGTVGLWVLNDVMPVVGMTIEP